MDKSEVVITELAIGINHKELSRNIEGHLPFFAAL